MSCPRGESRLRACLPSPVRSSVVPWLGVLDRGHAALGDAHLGSDLGSGDAEAAAHLGEPEGVLLGAQITERDLLLCAYYPLATPGVRWEQWKFPWRTCGTRSSS
jgi:hypothetical protein